MLAGEPPAEVRNGSGPVYPVFRCTDGYVRLVVLSPRQWRALREWLGEPEYLQDPELESFVARLMIAATVINPLLEEHFAQFGMDEAAAEAQRRGIVCTPALAAGAGARQRAPALTRHVRAARRRRTVSPHPCSPGSTSSTASVPDRTRHRRRWASTPSRSSPTSATRVRLPPPSAPAPAPPLAGVRVMDFGIGAVGVEVGRRLAEYGAEVIKIESRAYPDFMRTVTGGEFSPSFVSSSRSKLGFGANAQTPEGHDVLMKLAELSDVVIENNSTGTMDDLGLGFDDLLAVNPNIVMVSSQLMGSHGTWADWRGYGPTGQGPGGLLHLWNYADRDDPAGSASIYPDHYAGCLGAVGALAALVGRARGTNAGTARGGGAGGGGGGLARRPPGRRGRGAGLGGAVGQPQRAGGALGPVPAARARSSGSRSRAVTTPTGGACGRRWASPSGRPTRCSTPARPGSRTRRRSTRTSPSGPAPTPRTRSPHRCQEHGVPAAPMLTGTDMGTHPHYLAREFAIRIDQQVLGEMVLDGAAFHGELMVGPDVRGAPAIGEHTRAIATELLGLDDAEVDKLLATGALETTPPVTLPAPSELPD